MSKLSETFSKLSFNRLSLIALSIIFLVHLSFIPNGFTWLDHKDIEIGSALVSFPNLFLAVFQRFAETGFYRPMVTIIHSLDSIIYASSPLGFHLTNVMLHLLASFSVPFFLSCFFTLSKKEKVLSILIFGLHPIGFLPIGSISYRPEMLLVIFTFFTIYFHAKGRLENKAKYKLLSSLFFILALFSKETALFLIPALIAFWELIKRGDPDLKKRKKDIFAYFGLVLFVYVSLRLWAVPEIWRTSQISLGLVENIGTRLSIVGKLLVEFLIPLKPPLSDSVRMVGVSISSLFSLFAIVLSFVFVVKNGIKKDFSKAIILFLILLLPALSLIPAPRLGSPHYGYIAIAGFTALLILVIKEIERKKYLSRNALFILISFVLLLYSASSFLSGFNFKNDLTLFKKEVEYDPTFSEGWYYLGNYYLEAGDFKLSSNSFKIALEPKVDVLAYFEKYSALVNLSASELGEENYENAEKYLLEAEELAPDDQIPGIRYNLAIIATRKKDYQKAVDLLKKDYDYWQTPEPFLVMANAYHYLKKPKEAVESLEKALTFSEGEKKQQIELLIKNERLGKDSL